MILTDTHTHLYAKEFDHDREEVIKSAFQKGVQYFLLPNIDESSINPLHELCNQWPGHVLPMMGLHPTSVTQDFESQLQQIFGLFNNRKYHAVGEIGIDLYWDTSLEQEQRIAFIQQCKNAIEMDLPVAIHMRNSYEAIMDELKKLNDSRLRGVFHCFTGNHEQAAEILDMGFYLGIGGVLTFKNTKLGNVIKDVPLEKIVLETDAPYLAPHPYRGKRNESSYIPLIARKLADINQTDIEIVAEKTTTNAKQLFGF
mgnify:CR=1 FL=1